MKTMIKPMASQKATCWPTTSACGLIPDHRPATIDANGCQLSGFPSAAMESDWPTKCAPTWKKMKIATMAESRCIPKRAFELSRVVWRVVRAAVRKTKRRKTK